MGSSQVDFTDFSPVIGSSFSPPESSASGSSAPEPASASGHGGTSLLQVSVAKIRVYQFGLAPTHLLVGSNDTFQDVLDQLGNNASTSLVPVFPQATPSLQCLAYPASAVSQGLPALLSFHRELDPVAVLLPSGSTAPCLRRRFSLPSGEFWIADHLWTGPGDGWLPGMGLTFHAGSFSSADRPVGATIPQSLPGFSLSGARKDSKHDRAPAPVGLLRAIPTPLRNCTGATKICLSDRIPLPSPAFTIGVEASMLDHCLQGHRIEGLGRCLPPSSRLDSRLRSQWDSLPWFGTVSLDEAFLFTDGSYESGLGIAGWAVVILGTRLGVIGRVGFAHGRACEHQDACNAFHAELEALLHAHAFASCIDAKRVHIGVDCSAALQVGNGLAPVGDDNPVGRACLGLQFAADPSTARFQHKVAAHEGCLPNEIADGLAKASVFDCAFCPCPSLFSTFWAGVQERVFDWLWVSRYPSSPQLPFLSADGSWSMAACAARTSTAPQTLGLDAAPADPSPFHFDFRVVQYNCLSMRGQAASELIATALDRLHVAIAGFQETRRRDDGIRQEGQFWVVSSPCQSNGHEGCQVWIHSRRPLTCRGVSCPSPVLLDLSKFPKDPHRDGGSWAF